jgi:hypothetical protein
MNKPKILVLTIALLVMTLSLNASPKDEGVSAVKSKHNDLFMLKTCRKFVGATVEVISSRGEIITSKKMSKRKMIIDFKYVQQGSYTVRLVKGSNVREFNYLNI